MMETVVAQAPRGWRASLGNAEAPFGFMLVGRRRDCSGAAVDPLYDLMAWALWTCRSPG